MQDESDYTIDDRRLSDKRCSMCKEIKPYSQYYRDRSRPDGYGHRCKSCSRVHAKPALARYYKSNRDKVIAAVKYSRAHRARETRLCANCGAEVTRCRGEYPAPPERTYCNNKCRWDHYRRPHDARH